MTLSPPPTLDPPEVVIPGRPRQTEKRQGDSRLPLSSGSSSLRAGDSKAGASSVFKRTLLKTAVSASSWGFPLLRSLFAFRDINFTHALLPRRKWCRWTRHKVRPCLKMPRAANFRRRRAAAQVFTGSVLDGGRGEKGKCIVGITGCWKGFGLWRLDFTWSAARKVRRALRPHAASGLLFCVTLRQPLEGSAVCLGS